MLYLALLAGLTLVSGHNPLKPLFSWKQLDWNFPNDAVRQNYLSTGRFIPTNNMPLGINVWQGKMFISVSRWRPGVPASLNYINLNETIAAGISSPPLNPYPSWEDNDITADNAIVDVLRLRIDACDRMWAFDSGVDDNWGARRRIQQPKLIVIDLRTNQIIDRHTLKDGDLTSNSFIGDNVVDVDPQNCNDAYVYMSDPGGYGLIVYSLARRDSWRIQNNYLYFNPLEGDYHLNQVDHQMSDGVFGLALNPPAGNGPKTLYFQAMSSSTVFAVSTDLLKDQVRLANRTHYKDFQIVGNKGPNSQGTVMRLDPVTGAMYFTQLSRNALACWDTHSELNPNTFHIVAQDNVTMIFPNDLAIDLSTRQLYLTTNDYSTFQYSQLDWSRNNFYVHVASLDDLAPNCKTNSVASILKSKKAEVLNKFRSAFVLGKSPASKKCC